MPCIGAKQLENLLYRRQRALKRLIFPQSKKLARCLLCGVYRHVFNCAEEV
jgi:hypothetical protein